MNKPKQVDQKQWHLMEAIALKQVGILRIKYIASVLSEQNFNKPVNALFHPLKLGKVNYFPSSINLIEICIVYIEKQSLGAKEWSMIVLYFSSNTSTLCRDNNNNNNDTNTEYHSSPATFLGTTKAMGSQIPRYIFIHMRRDMGQLRAFHNRAHDL